jgi:hypothetical protein
MTQVRALLIFSFTPNWLSPEEWWVVTLRDTGVLCYIDPIYLVVLVKVLKAPEKFPSKIVTALPWPCNFAG